MMRMKSPNLFYGKKTQLYTVIHDKGHFINSLFAFLLISLLLTACGGNNKNSEIAKNKAISIITAYAEDGSKSKPSLQDYIDAGVVGVTQENLDQLNAIVDGLQEDEVDTTEELNALTAQLGVNLRPAANAGDDRRVQVNQSVTLTGSGTDSDGTIVGFEWWEGATVLSTSPSVTYTPVSVGTYTLELIVTDDDGATGSDTVDVIASDAPTVNQVPTATSLSIGVDEDTVKVITLTGSDPESASLSYSITTQPANGLLSGSAPNVTYTPNVNYNGSDSFAFTVSDGENTSAAATVSLTITAVNDAPSVNDAAFKAKAGEAKGIVLTGSDPDSTSLSYVVTQQPANGMLSGNAPNLTYTANANYSGADSFKFTVSDGDKTSAEATVTITITPTDSLDRDGDGVNNDQDAFPDDPNESADLDGDGIGDNADTDRDGDGVNNDQDVFPNDPNESADLDGDGIGDNADTDRDGDGVNNEDDFFPDDKNASSVPVVKILTPDTLITVGSSPITISGTIDSPDARLVVNGVDVQHTGGQFEVDVSLEEGLNNIVARGIDASNHEGLATITVSLDKTPPHVTVQSLKDGQTVYSDKVSVGGLVNDIVRGAVTNEDAVVRVNGKLATVNNRSYLAKDIPLTEGENTIKVIASDAVGNVGSKSIKVNYEVQTNKIISEVSGQSQTSVILGVLTEPLKVKLAANGIPVVDKTVVFRIIQGDGLLQSNTASEGNGAVVKTDANGEASVSFKLGSRAGNGNHRVRARAVGFDGEIIFHASANYGDGNKAGVIAGNNQRGAVRQPLPQPFVLAVTDAGANLIPDADIEFKVTVGTGKFQNGEKTYLTKTDKDGRASAHFTLGAEEGLDKQRISATLVGTNARTGFTVSGFMPGDPGQTSVVGVVLDNQDKPIPAVTVRVDGTSRQAITDAQGQFKITEVPVGPVHLLVEGSTTTRAGEWPTLSYNIVTVPGVENPLASPIYLVELDMNTATNVGAEDVELTLPEMPGFKLKVKAGSVTFPDGSKTGKLSITPVNANKIPMPPPNGMQPQFIVTIQPHGAKFDPPAELTLPNVDGHLPGAEVEMYSYDHDLEEFVTIGLGTVSRDGSTVTTNVGVGVIKAGWHCGSGPGGSACAHSCKYCEDCTDSCDCVINEPREKKPEDQTPNDCKTALCGGGSKAADDPAKDIPKDCKEPICIGTSHDTKPDDSQVPDDTTPVGDCKISGCLVGNQQPVESDSDKPRPQDDPDNYCKTCAQGNIVADADKDNFQLPSDKCKVCQNGASIDVEIDVAPLIPDGNKYCIGESIPLTITTIPQNRAVSFTSKNGNVLASGGPSAFKLEAIKAGREEDVLTVDYQGCSADTYGVLVVPRSVNDLWNLPLQGDSDFTIVEEATTYKNANCSLNNQQSININHSIDGCSGPSPQRITEQGNTLINVVANGVVFDLFTGPEPIWGEARSPNPPFGSSDPLACNTHDICYQTCGSSQDTCDQGLKQNISSSCKLAYPSSCIYFDGTAAGNAKCAEYDEERAFCEQIADAFYVGLSIFGKTAHDTRQIQYCDCCQP